MLKAESRKKANTAVVSTLMDKTFAQRRAEILKSTAPVEALLQEYPFLGTQKEVGCILQKVTLSQVHSQFSTQETRPIVNCGEPFCAPYMELEWSAQFALSILV